MENRSNRMLPYIRHIYFITEHIIVQFAYAIGYSRVVFRLHTDVDDISCYDFGSGLVSPQSGYILYDNTEDAKDRDFDKLINHYGYEDDKIYCVLKCDHGVIFYYDKKRKQIYRKDIDSFINGGWFIQIGYDEKLAEYGKSLDYFKLSKMINDRLEGKSSSIMKVYE